jgi:DNA-binding transcriptional MerR regulator/methylmalonyl-CoA mutase cobalamin-binding subunit
VRGIYPIQTVSLRTGLSPHVIRAWERRYNVVEPIRSEGRRLYSEADVAYLSLLKQAVENGNRIGSVASLSVEELRSRVWGPTAGVEPRQLSERVARALSHAAATDARRFDAELYEAVQTYGDNAVVEAFIFPVLRELGERWREGKAHIAEEHLVTAIIRSYFSSRLRDLVPPADAPMVVIASLEGELHDIGALAGAVRAREAGWNATFLGANTPAEAMADVAANTGARVVIVVITMEESEASITVQLDRLSASLPRETDIAIAGNPSEGTATYAESLGFTILRSMRDLDVYLTSSSPRDDE